MKTLVLEFLGECYHFYLLLNGQKKQMILTINSKLGFSLADSLWNDEMIFFIFAESTSVLLKI